MYKIAIIDDEMGGEIGRKDYYERVFGKYFEIVKLISTPEEISKAPEANVHAYIVDLVYGGEKKQEKNEYRGITFDGIIKNINAVKNVPIILVTSKWETFKQPYIVGQICKCSNIVMCIDWNSFTKSDNGAFFYINQMRNEISQFYHHTSVVKENDETVTILHLSDLQFGDKNFDSTSIFAQYDIATKLYDLNKVPDILVISGDIASHGTAKEYDLAYTWLAEFAEQLWGRNENWSEKVVIVPGNHDIDYSMFIANEYEWNFDDKDFANTHSLIKRKSNDNEYGVKSMLDYAKFMRKVCGDSSYFDEYDSLYRVNERFINWGVRFYEMNTARNVSPMKPKNVHVRSEDYNKLKRNTVRIEGASIFNIVVSHYGPESIGFRSDINEKIEEWNTMHAFIESSEVHLLCTGHVHKSEIRKLDDRGNGARFSRNAIVSTASTCSLNVLARPSEEKKGFNILELERKDGIVVKLKGYEYKFDGGRITIPAKEDIFTQDIIYRYE